MTFNDFAEALQRQKKRPVLVVGGEQINVREDIEVSLSLLEGAQKFRCSGALPELKTPIMFSQMLRSPYPIASFQFDNFFSMDEVRGNSLFVIYKDERPIAQHWEMKCFWLLRDYLRPMGTIVHRDGAVKTYSLIVDLEQSRRLFGSAVVNVAAFLAALECVNVQPREVIPAPALQKRRRERGKPPIYSHWILELKAGGAERRALLGGSHESPRIHLRRGHIKHRRTGNFWWQPCVVGDRRRGLVVKDYELA